MAEKKKLSMAEMLAAARAADGGEAVAKPPAEPAAEAPAQPEQPAAEAPAKPAAPAKKGGKAGSVAEMLAMARAEGAPGSAAKPESKPASKPKPAAAAAKTPAKAAAKPAASTKADWESPSILTGGSRKDQPRPLSKAEAAAKEKEAPAKAGKPKRVAPPMPQKPAYAKPAGKADADTDSRRGFLAVMLGTALGIGYTAMATTFGLWGLALARFMFPNVLREPPSQFKVGFPSDYSFGMVETKYKAQFGVWIVRYEYNGAPELYALSTVCTHLGCTPNWLEGEQKFKCPCHGSGFYKDGINFEGPAPRPLERYAIKIADDGQIEVDKSRKFQQEMGQWDDPASYIPV